MLHADVGGNPEGEPVLFVHGFMSSNLQWEPNRAGLAEHLRLIEVEQPGHGRSSIPDHPSGYGPDVVLSELERIRAELGIERWWVAGHSLGGAVVLGYALRHPHRTAGVIFTNSRAAFGQAGRDEAGDPERPPPTAAQIRRYSAHPLHAKRYPAELRDRMVEQVDAMDPATFAAVGQVVDNWNAAKNLHRLAVPTLLVNGRWEKRFQNCVAEARATIADLEVVELEGGHSINIEQPEGFNQAMLDFIGRTR